MEWVLFVSQLLNGLQLGVLLFLLAAGLTLVFGIMDLVNLAHGSLYMIGAISPHLRGLDRQLRARRRAGAGRYPHVGMAVEVIAMRRLYGRDHLDHVLGTFGLICFSTKRCG